MADASRDKALAGRIRAGGSDTYDLAGYSPLQAADLMQAAFGVPIEASEMMKVTLVVGGGKKVRTAYGGTEGLVRDVCSALEKLGFADDRGASCTLECQGSFKYQHDTDKARRRAASSAAQRRPRPAARPRGWRSCCGARRFACAAFGLRVAPRAPRRRDASVAAALRQPPRPAAHAATRGAFRRFRRVCLERR